MTIKIKPTSTTATIEHNDSTILTVDSSGNLTAENNLTIDGTTTATGNVTMSGNATISGTTTATGDVTMSGNMSVGGRIAGFSVSTSAGFSNNIFGGSGDYFLAVSWNNGNGYAFVYLNSSTVNTGTIFHSSNSSGGNNACDTTNNKSSNSGNGLSIFHIGSSYVIQCNDNWSANAYPINVMVLGA